MFIAHQRPASELISPTALRITQLVGGYVCNGIDQLHAKSEEQVRILHGDVMVMW